MSRTVSQQPLMMYRVCFVFFLFLAGVFYWRCTKDDGGGIVLAPQQCDGENTEFTTQQKVTISGYTSDAMEPFIKRDVNSSYLFFNSLNDGDDTSLYYATRVNDTVFTSGGKITGVNGTPPHLDAVASMDDDGKFYYITTRDYPASFKNVRAGAFESGAVTGLSAVNGNFYIETPGWLIMDCEVSPVGDKLYFVNAHFKGGSVPSSSTIGVASLAEAETAFNKDANSDLIMAKVNRNGCLDYAPAISADGKELFFTRFCFGSGRPSILVAKRNTTVEAFGAPACIGVLKGFFVEAPSLSYDGKKMYYHRRDEGVFAIYMVSRP